MPRLDLFALALANEAALQQQTEQQRSTLPAEHLARWDRFCVIVREKGGISVNMKPQRMLTFLRRGRYYSIYESAEEKALATGGNAEDEIRQTQGEYYSRRVFFDRSFEGGERFLYGALNIGGAGASEYGIFCIFLGNEEMLSLQSAFLPDNSLKKYVHGSENLVLDEATLGRETASPARRDCVAARKHAAEIPVLDDSQWDKMLCAREQFVEAVFVGDVFPSSIAEIRVDRGEMRRLSDLAFDDMRAGLHESDRAELDEFRNCMEKLADLKILDKMREV